MNGEIMKFNVVVFTSVCCIYIYIYIPVYISFYFPFLFLLFDCTRKFVDQVIHMACCHTRQFLHCIVSSNLARVTVVFVCVADSSDKTKSWNFVIVCIIKSSGRPGCHHEVSSLFFLKELISCETSKENTLVRTRSGRSWWQE